MFTNRQALFSGSCLCGFFRYGPGRGFLDQPLITIATNVCTQYCFMALLRCARGSGAVCKSAGIHCALVSHEVLHLFPSPRRTQLALSFNTRTIHKTQCSNLCLARECLNLSSENICPVNTTTLSTVTLLFKLIAQPHNYPAMIHISSLTYP